MGQAGLFSAESSSQGEARANAPQRGEMSAQPQVRDGRLTLSSLQRQGATRLDEQTHRYEARWRVDAQGCFQVSYAEPSGDQVTWLSSAPQRFWKMTRTGQAPLQLYFEVDGQVRPMIYPTPYGDLRFEQETLRLQWQTTEGGGKLSILYLLQPEGDSAEGLDEPPLEHHLLWEFSLSEGPTTRRGHD